MIAMIIPQIADYPGKLMFRFSGGYLQVAGGVKGDEGHHRRWRIRLHHKVQLAQSREHAPDTHKDARHPGRYREDFAIR
jgi:hypothetical protein